MQEIDFGRWPVMTVFESLSGMLGACKCEYSVTRTLLCELLSPECDRQSGFLPRNSVGVPYKNAGARVMCYGINGFRGPACFSVFFFV